VDIATCGAARAAKPEHLGSVGGGLDPVTKALRRLISRGLRLHIVYEAGPCGASCCSATWRHWVGTAR
jgi:transposase